jgi:hypothetical protein
MCDSHDTIGGRVRLRRPEISLISPLQLSPILGSSPPPGDLVLVTSNKFSTGVIVTGDNCSLVSLSPPINLSPVSLSLMIIVDTGEKFFAGINDTGDHLKSVDTSDKFIAINIHSRIYPRIFEQNLKRPQRNTWGPR